MTTESDHPVPPAVLWDWVTSPDKQLRWRGEIADIEIENPRGARGVGTISHCHGKKSYQSYDERFVDWKPFRYYSFIATGPLGEFLWTVELIPADNDARTVLSSRLRLMGGRRQRLAARLFGRKIRADMLASAERFAAMVRADNPTADNDIDPKRPTITIRRHPQPMSQGANNAE